MTVRAHKVSVPAAMQVTFLSIGSREYGVTKTQTQLQLGQRCVHTRAHFQCFGRRFATKLNTRTPVMMLQVRLTATSSRLSPPLENTTASACKSQCDDNAAKTACFICLLCLAMLCISPQPSQKEGTYCQAYCQGALSQGRPHRI